MARPTRQKQLTIGSWQFPLIGGRARVKQFEVRKKADSVVLTQRLRGVAELFQRSKPQANTLRLSVPTVFGKPKVITIGADWVQIGDRLFRAETPGKKV